MKQINNYIIEKLHLNKDTKVNLLEEEPVLLISHSALSNNPNYISFYYYEISDYDKNIIKLHNHSEEFTVLNHTSNDKYKYIFASSEWEDNIKKNISWGYVILKEDAINLIEEILQKPVLEWECPYGKFRIEKQIGLKRDNITLEEWLKKLLDWLKNGKS